MDLGAFSVSLTVKDLAASQAFYEKLGFAPDGGVPEQGWLVMRNGTTTIGLFHGMFDANILTFNPGWGPKAQPKDNYTDIRDLQKQLKASDVALTSEADENTTGPAHLTLTDPDGNVILIDQHV